MTREEFAKVLVLAFELYDEQAQVSFTDVASGTWYYNYIASAVRSGLIKGYGNSFGTGNYITRQDIAVMLYRGLLHRGTNITVAASPDFADWEEVSDYAREAVAALTAAEVTKGIGNNTFAPLHYATRAEVAKIVYEVVNLLNSR
jgi:hypothetical protein